MREPFCISTGKKQGTKNGIQTGTTPNRFERIPDPDDIGPLDCADSS
jgi:hypothetical protein